MIEPPPVSRTKGEPDQRFVHRLLVREGVVHKLDIEILTAENVDILAQ